MASTKTEERIAVLETKLDMQNKKLDDILCEIKGLPDKYVPRKEFMEFRDSVQIKAKTRGERYWEVMKMFLAPAITAVVVFVLFKSFGI